MKLQTKYFGEIDYELSQALTFPNGLFGFEEERSFLLLPFEGSGGTMLCLQSTATGPLAFVLLDPFSLDGEYSPELSAAELEQFGAEDISKLCCYVLCAVKNPVSASTVNLKCPVVVDPRTNEARQVILETDRYGMRHPLSEFKREGAKEC